MESCTVFYSWQSDLPNATNRGFIQRALEDAAKRIRDDESIQVEPVIDRDTAGVPGSPDIASTIFRKIDNSDVFACDVSIINRDEQSRSTPNPNVLIELGYALKALRSDRIIMIMNSAFGEPASLPFDLSKKRVVTYEVEESSEDKGAKRKTVTRSLEIALRAIIGQLETGDKRERGAETVTLRSKCEEVLAGRNVHEWRRLVDRTWDGIPEKMLAWKARAEQVWEKGGAEQETARLEAVEICMPSFIPILVPIDRGEEDLWREAVGPLRQLAVLSDSMGGGYTNVVEIGSHMLYVAGSIGMALAAQTKQLTLLNNWMRLPMPAPDRQGGGEKLWAQVHDAHHLWGKYIPDNREPFRDILRICESDYLSGLVPEENRLERYLYLANLAQSLFEFGRCAEDAECLQALKGGDRPTLDVWPVWGLMKPSEFKSATWELFGSGKAVLEFVSGGGVSPEKFWGWWKKWKAICVRNLMQGELRSQAPRPIRAEWLTLPGEPPSSV